MILDIFNVNIVSMSTSMSSRPSIIVGGPVVAMAISAASRADYQLILILGAVSSHVTWEAALEAQPILRMKGCNIGGSMLNSWLPRWWRRQGRWLVHTIGKPDATLMC